MSERKKIDPAKPETKTEELSEQDLEKVAGGGAGMVAQAPKKAAPAQSAGAGLPLETLTLNYTEIGISYQKQQ